MYRIVRVKENKVFKPMDDDDVPGDEYVVKSYHGA